jgi:hypothetical protein
MMKKALRLLLIPVVVIAAVVGLLFAYLEMRKERDLEASAETPVVAPSRVERDTNGGPVLRLDEATEKLLGLQTAIPAPGSVSKELNAPARVLDGAGLAAQLNDGRSAESALTAARADSVRKKKLFENGNNTTASAVEQAEALAKQQELLVETTRDRIAATWGGAIAGRDDLADFSRRLLARELALVRVDLLASDTLAAAPRTVRLLRLDGEAITTASVLGPAPVTDSTVAGQSLLCLVATNTASLVPGSMSMAHIDTGVSERGTVLPRTAVVRHAGLGWAYVQTAPHVFSRRMVSLEHPHPDGWLVSGEWTQPVLINGAQSLLSEELKGSIQMKD